jgi:hypothetical protein
MNAVAVEVRMELEGLGHELLMEWAPWARDDGDGSRHSWALKPRVDPGYHGDPPKNFFVVDKIVAPHRVKKDTYWKAASAFYLGERGLPEIGRSLGWSEGHVMTTLIVFAALVEREFRDYNDQRRGALHRAR